MKKILVAMLAASAVFAAVAGEEEYKDPNPFATYDACLKSVPGDPTLVEWQNAENAALSEAVKPEVLAAFVSSKESAAGLLSQVGEAYKTPALVLTQIAAVSQLVMCPACEKARKGRAIWAAALLEAAANAPDEYRTLFFIDQLRWCGRPSDAKSVKAVAAASGSRHVKDFAAIAIRELEASPE